MFFDRNYMYFYYLINSNSIPNQLQGRKISIKIFSQLFFASKLGIYVIIIIVYFFIHHHSTNLFTFYTANVCVIVILNASFWNKNSYILLESSDFLILQTFLRCYFMSKWLMSRNSPNRCWFLISSGVVSQINLHLC